MISYCIPVYRPWFAKRLIADLIRKTSTPYEILLWLNVADAELDHFIEKGRGEGAHIRVVGRTPENVGMQAFSSLFAEARYEMITQMDDDVICVSPKIAEICAETFARFPKVKQLVGDVWRDEFTTGARPEAAKFGLYDEEFGLYDGPIDGWFSVYHRSILPLLLKAAPKRRFRLRLKSGFPWVRLHDSGRQVYFYLGGSIKAQLAKRGQLGLLSTRFKVFHVVNPTYLSYFNALDFEIEKYRRLGRLDIAEHYEAARTKPVAREILELHIKNIEAALSLPPSGKISDRSIESGDISIAIDAAQGLTPGALTVSS